MRRAGDKDLPVFFVCFLPLLRLSLLVLTSLRSLRFHRGNINFPSSSSSSPLPLFLGFFHLRRLLICFCLQLFGYSIYIYIYIYIYIFSRSLSHAVSMDPNACGCLFDCINIAVNLPVGGFAGCSETQSRTYWEEWGI